MLIDTEFFQVAASIIVGAITATVANLHGRSSFVWFGLGLIFGPFALLALFFIPKVKHNTHLPDNNTAATQNKKMPSIAQKKADDIESEKKTDKRESDSNSCKMLFHSNGVSTHLHQSTIMTADWFYMDRASHKAMGPVPITVLSDLWTKNELTETSWVWCTYLKEWQRIQEIEVLSAYFQKEKVGAHCTQ